MDKSGTEIIKVQFARKDCTPCPVRPQCTRASIPRRRITLRTREQYEVLHQARINEDSPAWRARYSDQPYADRRVADGRAPRPDEDLTLRCARCVGRGAVSRVNFRRGCRVTIGR
ncbi:transposase [Nonomuraea sp. PA05]|uniref:transposase n=1 Tax=Nonomuraea sp. PA05 TaxID=2604466 RepID=UPI003983A695